MGLALLASLIVAAPRLALAAPPSALYVFGKAESRQLIVVQNVVEGLLRDASWPLVPPFNDNETSIVRGCAFKAQPWSCLQNIASKKGIERIVIMRVDLENSPDGTSQVIITGRLVYAGSPAFLEQKRFCGACSDEDLSSYSVEVAKLLMDERAILAGTTKIGVSSIPMGAEVRIDGKVVGITNSVFPAAPGSHTVEIRARGHRPEQRAVTAIEGKTVNATVTLQKGDENAPPGTSDSASDAPDEAGPEGSSSGGGGGEVSEGGSGFRSWGPKAMVGAGGALVLTGVLFAAVLDQDQKVYDRQAELDADPEYRNWAPAGVAFIVAGAALAGGGGYLWWKWMPESTAPSVATSRGGVVLGMSGAF